MASKTVTETTFNLVEFDTPPLGGTKAYEVTEDGVVMGFVTLDGVKMDAPPDTPCHIIEENCEPPKPAAPAGETTEGPKSKAAAADTTEAESESASKKKK